MFPEGGTEGTPVKLLPRAGPGTAAPSNCLHTSEMSPSVGLFVFTLTLASPGITIILVRVSLHKVFEVHWFQ